jgi:hypothetical protein
MYCIGYGKVRMKAMIPAAVRNPVIQRSLRERIRLRSNGRNTPESAQMNAMKFVRVEYPKPVRSDKPKNAGSE